ncbi:MAG: hypothetical protein JXP34_18760, partial [Planctomycetes bacterium]|nr:hypothetical protein [Planctomycetota bacterium]
MRRLVWIAVVSAWIPARAAEPDPAEIERLSKSGETLAVEIAARFPLRPQRVRDDRGINVLVDLSHQALFVTMWDLPRMLRSSGFRVSGSQATLDTVLVPGTRSRVRIPAGGRFPFAWWPTARYHVVVTHQADPNAQDYLPEEKEALARFVAGGGGLVIIGGRVTDPRASAAWPLNGLAKRFGASFATESTRFLGARVCALSLGPEWEATHRADGKPVVARRGSGMGRIAIISSLEPLKEIAKDLLPATIAWAAGEAPAAAGGARLPAEAAGGGPIYPEERRRIGNVIVYYARNQKPTLLETVEKDMPRIKEKVEGWLPSPPPDEPMHLILSAGGGGGWAVNAYLPKEVGIISLTADGILSVFAHELAHTMAGPPNAKGRIAGNWPHGNQGESHAGWFQGKAAALETGRRVSHEPNDLFRFDKDGKGLDLALSDEENGKRWGRGSQWTKIWWVWQKLDDRYGPTWYPRWRWVQSTRWQDDPDRRLTWDETVEDMSIAVGEDLFPFFIEIGTTLSKKRLASIAFQGKTLRLPVAPIKVGPAGAVRLEAVGDYTEPIGIRAAPGAAADPEGEAVEGTAWRDAMLAARGTKGNPGERWARIEREFPVEWDWVLQDHGPGFEAWFAGEGDAERERRMIRRALDELGEGGADLARAFERLERANAAPGDARWLDLYAEACERRRAERLAPLVRAWPRILFTKHLNLGGSHYAYTEGQSDAQNERQFEPGASLCLLDFSGGGTRGAVRTLLDDPNGVIRDPEGSYDAARILFSWKKSDRGDDYHLYEMDAESGAIRQLTRGLGFADYEGAYLPDGGIVFNSTRCVQTVDCWWTEVSNLYTCDGDGRYLRRLTFDQVHTNFPTVAGDGRN